MAIFKALTFDGVNSLDYGIYITGEAVYNAPERAVEMVNIPGKNGALALDQGRFENIEVTYHAGCFADSQTDFADKVMKFRNALASRYTYKRLTDEYHPDEYRLGLYKSGLEVDAVHYSTAGEFDITFDCKPQRFLTSGETALTPSDYIDTQTATGEIVTIDSDGSLGVKALKVALEPIQSLNGYDHPWVGGAGKNKLKHPYADGTSKVQSGITFTVNEDGSITANGTATTDSSFNIITSAIGALNYLAADTYIASGGTQNFRLQVQNNGSWLTDSGTEQRFTRPDASTQSDLVRVVVPNGVTVNNVTIYPMIRLASETDATYEPYSNICPISGRTEVVTYDDPKHGGEIEWNQKIPLTAGAIQPVDSTRAFDVTEKVWTFTATNLSSPYLGWYSNSSLVERVANNVLLIIASVKVSASCRVRIGTDVQYEWFTCNANVFTNIAKLVKPTSAMAFTSCSNIKDLGLSSFTSQYKDLQYFDLTQMFGSAKADEIYAMERAEAGSGVAYFKSLFPNDYYEYNSGETTCVSAVNGDEYRKYTTDLGRTVYGGTLDVVSGVLTVDRAMVDLGTWNWTMYSVTQGNLFRSPTVQDASLPYDALNLLCSHYPIVKASLRTDNSVSVGSVGRIDVIDSRYSDATSFKTAMDGVQLVYELATPQTYQLTPQQISLLLGENHLWSDGEITLTYGVHPYHNPTPFDAKPLIKVTGRGTLGIGEYILTITGTESQTLYIDCETMEIYTLEGTVPTGASSLVSINRNDFPVLEPGTNNISVGSGITAVTITPRWWRI